MSIKIQRIQANESGPFSPSDRTRAHIEVPSSVGFSDLANSNVVFRMQMQITNGENNSGPSGSKTDASKLLPAVIAQPHLNLAGASDNSEPVRVGGAQALIRDARATSSLYGQMSEMRDQNVIHANLDHFTDYWACHAVKEAYNGGGAMPSQYPANPSTVVDSPFLRPVRPTEINAPVTSSSQLVECEVRCPMKHLDAMAESEGASQFPNLAVGDMTYRINLENVRPVVAFAIQEDAFDDFVNLTPASNKVGDATTPFKYKYSNANAAGNLTGDILDVNFKGNLPFYVGMPVIVNYQDAGLGGAGSEDNEVRTISSLNVNGGVCEIIFDHPMATNNNAADAITNITLTPYVAAAGDAQGSTNAATVSYRINDIFLELHTLNLTPQQVDAASKALNNLSINYVEHRLVKKVLNSTGDYAETLHVDAGCSNVAAFTPQNNGLVSGYDKAREYRWSVDGNYMTNRAIRVGPDTSATGQGVGNQIHKHFLQKYFGNLGKQLLSFEDVYDDYSQALLDEAIETDNHNMYPLVMPMLGSDVIVNFQLRCDGANTMNTKEIYYLMSYPRVLNFENGRLMK